MFSFTPDKLTLDPEQRFGPVKESISGFEQELARKKTYDPTKGQVAESRQQQIGLGRKFEDIIAGKTPSVAEQQMRIGQEAAIKAAAAQTGLASARGGGYSGLARGLAGAQVQSAQDIANQAALLRAQEQEAAMSQYGNLLQGMRGQDIQAQQVAMQDRAAVDEIRMKLMGIGVDAANAEQIAQQEVEKMRIEGEESKRGFWGNLAGQVAKAGISLAFPAAAPLMYGADVGKAFLEARNKNSSEQNSGGSRAPASLSSAQLRGYGPYSRYNKPSSNQPNWIVK